MKHIKMFENFKTDIFDFTSKEDFEIFIKDICEKMNINYSYITFLSEGGNGIAVDLGNNILKLTTDFSEAYLANKLKNITSKNLVKIYKVVELLDNKEYSKTYAIHQEKLITHLNPSINTFLYYLHKNNSITKRIKYVSDDEVYDFFKDKMLSLNRDNIILLFNKWKNVYLECMKYDIPLSDFHGKNVGIRKSNPTELVYFDISNPYEIYDNKILNIEKIIID
jgi:hypothetical protein